MREIEEEYNTMAGQVLVAVKQLTWLLDATAAIALSMGSPREFVSRIETLTFRVKHGIQAEGSQLMSVVGNGISRSALTALVDQGFHTPQALVEASAGVLESWMSRSEAAELRERAFRVTQGTSTIPDSVQSQSGLDEIVLKIDEARPGEIRLKGKKVELQDKQYRLITLLAENAGNCVSYDEIYETLWKDTIVEANQIHFQKRKLKKAIEAAVPEYSDIIKTIPKRGFTLQLSPFEVELVQSVTDSAQMALNVEPFSEELVSSLL
jgi:DNA-binding winged helix-turn-helix (wHTH) protein